MDDQRVEGRASLCCIDLCNSGTVGGIRAKSIDGFGREGDEAAVLPDRHGFGDAGGVGSKFKGRFPHHFVATFRLFCGFALG